MTIRGPLSLIVLRWHSCRPSELAGSLGQLRLASDETTSKTSTTELAADPQQEEPTKEQQASTKQDQEDQGMETAHNKQRKAGEYKEEEAQKDGRSVAQPQKTPLLPDPEPQQQEKQPLISPVEQEPEGANGNNKVPLLPTPPPSLLGTSMQR